MMGLIQLGWSGLAVLAAMIPMQPPAASTIAGEVDQLYYLLTGITLFFTVLIFSIIFYFMVKYRRRTPDEKELRLWGRRADFVVQPERDDTSRHSTDLVQGYNRHPHGHPL